MATTQDYIEFVCEQVRGEWDVRYKKMFGEYMVYINNKPVLTVCDNTVFVKQLDSIKSLMAGADTGYPYTGAKECYILDIEDAALAYPVLEILERETPLPKPRKPKVKK